MEATLVWTGMWTSIVLSVMVVVPVLVEFCKRNLPICFGMSMAVILLYLLAPYSAGAREVWSPLEQAPANLQHFIDGLSGLKPPAR